MLAAVDPGSVFLCVWWCAYCINWGWCCVCVRNGRCRVTGIRHTHTLHDHTLALTPSLRLGPQHRSDGFVKHLLKAALCQGRALHVLDGPHLVGQLLALLALQRHQTLFGERAQRFAVVPQIDLGACGGARQNKCIVDINGILVLFCVDSFVWSVCVCDSPTRIMGASGQWCLISGYHFDVTFSKEEGLYVCVCGKSIN